MPALPNARVARRCSFTLRRSARAWKVRVQNEISNAENMKTLKTLRRSHIRPWKGVEPALNR